MKNKKSRLLLTFMLIAFSFSMVWAQQLTVHGTVTEASTGEPIIGASVVIEGTTEGTITDVDGNFSLQVAKDARLKVSFVGYNTEEVNVAGKNKLSISLSEDKEVLEEVVVVAYGTVKSKNFTGSVDNLKLSDSPLGQMGYSDPTAMLNGSVSGISFTESESVGESAAMVMRGQKSIGATTQEPMLVVDGMIYKGTLNDIDPQNIESISLLKDASSLAAYGSQAAQGVIMVTTKKGKLGKPIVALSTTQSWSGSTHKPNYMDGSSYIRLRNARLGLYDSMDDTSFMTSIEKKNYQLGQTTDWYDVATRTGYSQTYNLNVSGATENVKYYIGGGYTSKEGIIRNDQMKRYNLTTNLESKINKWIDLGLKMDLTMTNTDGISASIDAGNIASPYGSAYFDNTGNMRRYPSGEDDASENPLYITDSRNVNSRNRRDAISISSFANFQIPGVKGLTYRINASFSRISTEEKAFYHEQYFPQVASGNNEDDYSEYLLSKAYGYSSRSNEDSWVIDHIIGYTRDFGAHSVSASLVGTFDSDKVRTEGMTGTDFSNLGNTLLGWFSLGEANTRDINNMTYTLHNDIGFLARGIYSYKDKYHLNASVRRDGSSVFGKDHKWGTFPAFGAAWSLGKESFMQGAKWLNDLKIKASWGKNGSQTLSPYGTLSKLQMGRNSGLGIVSGSDGTIVLGQLVSSIGNPELAWQTTEAWNGGFEASMLNRRLNLEVNYYYSKTTDQIRERNIPVMGAGVTTQLATMGRVDNWGIEVNASSTNIKTKNFQWTSSFIFTLNRNKLKELWGGDNDADSPSDNLWIGRSLTTVWDYDYDGIVQEDGKGSLSTAKAGEPNIIDQNQDGVLDDNDKVFLGEQAENFRMSLSNTFNYKNFQLYFMLTGTFGGGGHYLGLNNFAYKTNCNVAKANSLDIPYWTPTNHNNEYPAATDWWSNWHVYNSRTNIRLQDVSLSYNLTNVLKKCGLSSARIYLSGTNLFYIATSWKEGDPEAPISGVAYSAMSRPGLLSRSFNVGMNLSF